MTEGVVRRAGTSDVAALVQLRSAMFTAMEVAESDFRWRENAHRWFTSRLHDPDYRFVVVEVQHQVVACAVGAIRDAAPSPSVPEGRDVLVSNVCTAAPFRGHGYGRMAFEAVMTWASDLGVRRAELMATEGGRSMYERAGFRNTTFPAMRAPLR